MNIGVSPFFCTRLWQEPVRKVYRKGDMEASIQNAKGVRTVKQENAEDLHDDVRKIIEDVRKARDYSRQASVLSVAAIVICAITSIIRLLTA